MLTPQHSHTKATVRQQGCTDALLVPMILFVDNMGAVGLANNWSVSGRTRHVDVKQNYLRELKERGFIHVKHKSGKDLIPDVGTKNVPVEDFWNKTDTFMSSSESSESC